MMPLTVVEDPDPGVPQFWEDAARICVWEIFGDSAAAAAHLEDFAKNGKSRIISSSPELHLDDRKFEIIIECIRMIDQQFEGMINTFEWFDQDPAYWIKEWNILGSIAAAAGINQGIFNSFAAAEPEAPAATPRKKSQKVTDRDVNVFLSCESIAQTLAEKQHDYGHHNIARFGRQGLLVRVHDKIARLKNLSLAGGGAKNEPIADTYMDIIGYCAIGMMWERGWFLLNLSSEFNKRGINEA